MECETTKLNKDFTEDDFGCLYFKKDDAGPESFQLTIRAKSKKDCKTKQQQILNWQAIVNDIQEISQRTPQSEEDKTIIKCLKEILSENTLQTKGEIQ